MKKYIFILVAMAFLACEQSGFVEGTVIDFQSGDSIEGIDIGLYRFNLGSSLKQAKWSDIDLIATATSNNEGYFSMEVDAEISISRLVFLPLLPKDTLSLNIKYTPSGSHDSGSNISDAINGMYKLKIATNVLVKLINFSQEVIEIHFDDKAVRVKSIFNYLSNTSYNLLPGQQYKFDLYALEFGNSEKQLGYLGSCSHFIKTQLPEDRDKVDWLMPLQTIEIDYNTLEKRLLD